MPPELHNTQPVKIQTPLIPIIFGQADARNIPEKFPFIDAWAVPVHKAMNMKGKFRSGDMKDYLGLSLNQKLILSTAGPDDFMEMLWEKGDCLDLRKYGFDNWFPAHFSVYDNDSKFYQFFNSSRQHVHARMVKSQFIWFRLGEHIPVQWFKPLIECKSIIISCQQMYNRFNRQLLKQEIEIADKIFPLSTNFFMLGSGYNTSLQIGRIVHEVHTSWIIQGLKGFDMKHIYHKQLSRNQLLNENLKELYSAVCKRHIIH